MEDVICLPFWTKSPDNVWGQTLTKSTTGNLL